MFSKKVSFISNDLGKEATLMLAFANPIDGSYRGTFPVVYNTIKFPSEGPFNSTLNIENQYAVLKPVVVDETLADVAAFRLIDVGQLTGLTRDENGIYSFTNPNNVFQVKNDSARPEDMALGLFRPNQDFVPTPFFFFREIGPESSIQVEFKLVLRAYITDKFHDKQILFGGVNEDAIWEQDLSKLNEHTIWTLTYAPETGEYKITAA